MSFAVRWCEEYGVSERRLNGAGDHLVAIDGKNTQNLTMQEVKSPQVYASSCLLHLITVLK